MWMELSLSKWSLLCFFSLNGCFYARLFIEVTLVIYIPNCLMDVNMLNYFVTSKWNEPSIIHWKNLLCVMLIDNWLLIKDCSVKTRDVSNPKIMNFEVGELDKPQLPTIMNLTFPSNPEPHSNHPISPNFEHNSPKNDRT